MLNNKPSMLLMAVGLFAVIGLSQVVLETLADARAGGGRSSGFRGSRTTQAPSRQAEPPRREVAPQPPQQPAPVAPQPGGFMRGLGTAVLGGFLGSMLFSGLANAAGFGGLGGSGFGMLEILLIGGLAYFLFRKFKASSSPAAATGYARMQHQDAPYQWPSNSSYSYNNPQVQEPSSFDRIDYRSLTMMDRSFNPDQFLKTGQEFFFKVQGAWNKQDIATLRSLCGADLMKGWEAEITQLKARGQKNRMDNIALRESEITEAWTENGADYITVRFYANLLDYTVDEKSGAVVSGSDSHSIEFEEFWTFSRPVGPNAWKLTAVQQG